VSSEVASDLASKLLQLADDTMLSSTVFIAARSNIKACVIQCQ
jgi:hypothetical protein